MEEQNAFQRWNRRSLNAYWLAIAIFAVFASAYTKWGHAPGASWVRTVAVPTAILVGVTVALEGLLRAWPKGSPYAVIVGSYVCIFVVGWAVPYLYVVIALLGTPLVLSLVHQRRGVVWLSLSLSYATFALLLVSVYAPHRDATLGGILVGIGFLVMTTWFTLQVFERIQEMVRILDRHSVARQELLVENIQMERLSKLDPLTQLYNRQALADYLARVIEVCQHHALDLHLAVVDVDDFKQINDSFGHDVGDLVLKGVAELMRQQLPTDHFVARYGGEEFVVLGIGIPFHTFYEQMERLRVQVSAQPLTARPVTVSIGIHTHVPGETAAQLFRYADQNLYWSKGQGKNQVRTSWDGDPQRPDDPPQAPALT